MPIVILGWGSLIWDPRQLPREGIWERGGPTLPIEFSRVSRDARLTLVVDRTAGIDVVTRYVRSPRALIDDAIEDLATREGTPKNRIGFVDLSADRSSATSVTSHAQTCATVRAWAEVHGFNGVVWTALASNFREETGHDFSVETAIRYLQALPRTARSVALHYIRSAPDEVVTPVRTAIAAIPFPE
jgi:hypothetical protein